MESGILKEKLLAGKKEKINIEQPGLPSTRGATSIGKKVKANTQKLAIHSPPEMATHQE